MPHFTADWFTRNIEPWRDLFRRLKWDRRSRHTAVEVGPFEGRSTLWILENLLQHADSRIHCIDLFLPTPHNSDPRTTFVTNVARHAHKIDLIESRSFDGLGRLYASGVRADFVYIDGSHYGANVLEDLVLSFRLTTVGGLIVCDDYLWSIDARGSEDVLNSPKIAIDAFTTIFRRKLHIVPHQPLYQLAFVKTAD